MRTISTNSGDDTGGGRLDEKKANPAPCPPPMLANDLLWGVQEIADAINRSPRQCFHLLEKNRLPAKKVGGRWCSSQTALRKYFEMEIA